MRLRPVYLLLLCATLSAATDSKRSLRIPFYFEPNRGQFSPEVLFLSRGPGYNLFLTQRETVLTLRKGAARHEIRVRLVGSAGGGPLRGTEAAPARINYLTAHAKATDIPTYRGVGQEQVYPGIDVVYYSNRSELEYDFTVTPGADPAQIRLSFEGADDLRMDAAGDLTIATSAGELRERKPEIYQMRDGKREAVAGGFRMIDRHTAGFEIGEYDRSRPLVIDPSLAYATYLGGIYSETFGDFTADAAGNLYITGYTDSPNFPVTAGAYKTACGTDGICNGGGYSGTDVFVTKLNPAGTDVVYSTFVGGSSQDTASRIRVDAAGEAVVYGQSASPDFPVTAGAYSLAGSYFLFKLNAAGSGLIYSTFLPSPLAQSSPLLGVDAAGGAYLATTAYSSTGLPVTAGAAQRQIAGSSDVYLLKLNAAGTAAEYGTFLGGSRQETVSSLTVDSAGNAYVAGATYSTDLPFTASSYQSVASGGGGSDGFVCKVNAGGASVAFCSYFTPPSAAVQSVALDGAGRIILAGVLSGTVATTSGTLTDGGSDYIARFDPAMTTLLTMARFGSGQAWADSAGNVYTVSAGNLDQLSPDLKTIQYSAVLNLYYYNTNLTVDAAGDVFLAQTYNNPAIGTANAFQPAPGGGSDVYLQKVVAAGGTLRVFPSSLNLVTTVGGSQSVSGPWVWTEGTPGAVGVPITVTPGTGASWLNYTAYTTTVAPSPQVTNSGYVFVTAGNLAAGTYTSSLIFSAPGMASVTVPVTLTVTNQPTVYSYLYTNSIFFGLETGSVPTTSMVVESPNPFTVTADVPWLQFSSTSGPANLYEYITVTPYPFSPTYLGPGLYPANITITSPGTAGSPYVLPLLFQVGNATLTASPGSLAFVQQTGKSAPPSQAVAISDLSTYGQSIPGIQVTPVGLPAWLSVTSSSPVTPAVWTVSVNPAGLAKGVYRTALSLSATDGSTATKLPITLTITDQPPLVATPARVSFSAITGAASPGPATVAISGDPSASFTFASSAPWLAVSTSSGTPPANLLLIPNTTGIAAGTYTATVTVTPTAPGRNVILIPVTLTVSAPISVTPTFLFFRVQSGDTTVQQQSLALSTPSGTTAGYNVVTSGSGVTAAPSSGTAPGSLTVSVDPRLIPSYGTTGLVTVYTADNSTVLASVPVTITVGPYLTLSRSVLTFSSAQGATTPLSQTVLVASGTVAAPISAQATSDGGWLSVSPTSFTTPGTLTVTANPTGLTPGMYIGNIQLRDPSGALGTSASVTLYVGLQLSVAPASLAFTLGPGGSASQTLAVTGPSVDYSATTAASWISLGAPTGTTPGQIGVTVSAAGLSPGSYSGSITINSSTASNKTVTVPVSLTVTSVGSTFQFGPPSFYFTSDGINDPDPMWATASGVAGQTFSAVPNAAWLTVNPTSGVLPMTVAVRASARGLSPGTYNAVITAQALGTGGATQAIPVTFTVRQPAALAVTPSTLVFSYQRGASAPPAQNLNVPAPAGLSYQAAVPSTAGWLSVMPSSGMGSGTLAVSVNTAGLVPGSYTANLLLTGPIGSTLATVPVTLVVTDPVAMAVSPSSLTFAYQLGTQAPAAKALTLGGSTGTYPYSLSTAAPWLTVSPASGTSPGTATVTANPSGMAVGTYTSVIQVVSAGATNSPQSVAVTLTVSSQPVLAASPASLSVTYHVGDVAPDGIALHVTSPAPVNFTADPYSRGWLALTPDAGATPADITVWVNPYELPPGTYQGQVQLAPAGALTTQISVPVTLTVVDTPTFTSAGVMNAASYQPGWISPGGMAAIFGSALAIQSAQAPAGPLPASLAGTKVTLNGAAAPLYSVASGQIVFQVPAEAAVGDNVLRVITDGVSSAPLLVNLKAAAPGIAVDQSATPVRNQDGTANSAGNGAPPGSVLVVYLTGLGSTSPSLASGQPAPSDSPIPATAPVTAQLSGKSAEVLFAGAAPGMTAAYQVNLRVPADAAAGAAAMTITAAGVSSNQVQVYIAGN
jgi:uncharacterized protein (TIGR03437 family)